MSFMPMDNPASVLHLNPTSFASSNRLIVADRPNYSWQSATTRTKPFCDNMQL